MSCRLLYSRLPAPNIAMRIQPYAASSYRTRSHCRVMNPRQLSHSNCSRHRLHRSPLRDWDNPNSWWRALPRMQPQWITKMNPITKRLHPKAEWWIISGDDENVFSLEILNHAAIKVAKHILAVSKRSRVCVWRNLGGVCANIGEHIPTIVDRGRIWEEWSQGCR